MSRPASEAACYCGHSVEEHGNDPKYPGSTACQATVGRLAVGASAKTRSKRCDCIAYEAEDES